MINQPKLLDKEAFAALPANEKRKAICQDVLDRIELDLINPSNGNFFRNRVDLVLNFGQESPQSIFNSQQCEVCAKGAIMCSWVGNFNNCDFDSILGFSERIARYGSYPKELLDIFGRKMLDNIEAAFETFSYSWHLDRQESYKYTLGFERGDLKSIMEYIIANDGEFPIHESWVIVEVPEHF